MEATKKAATATTSTALYMSPQGSSSSLDDGTSTTRITTEIMAKKRDDDEIDTTITTDGGDKTGLVKAFILRPALTLFQDESPFYKATDPYIWYFADLTPDTPRTINGRLFLATNLVCIL